MEDAAATVPQLTASSRGNGNEATAAVPTAMTNATMAMATGESELLRFNAIDESDQRLQLVNEYKAFS